jgi:hypothetical protein
VRSVAPELGHVHPGAEGGARSREHHGADLGLFAQRAKGVGQLDSKVDREGISLLGPLQGDDGDVLPTLQ